MAKKNPAAEEAAPNEAAPNEAAATKARVLCACVIAGEPRSPDDVVEVPANELAALVELSAVDPHADAVAYAEGLAAAAAAAAASDKPLE